MSTSSERAAELRRQADALDNIAHLEDELAAAKAAYIANPDSEDAKEAKNAAAEALRAARSETRTEGVSVGGDAYVMKEADTNGDH